MEDHDHEPPLRYKPTWHLGRKTIATDNYNKHRDKRNRINIQNIINYWK